MLRTKIFSKVAVVAGAVVAVSVSGIGSASASPAEEQDVTYQVGDRIPITVVRDGGITARGVAPSCINAYRENVSVQVQNDCAEDWRVKVKIKFLPDSQCKLVVAGTRTNIFTGPGTIDGVETC